MKLLEKEDYAFSNDSEAPEQKVANLLKQHKQAQLKLSAVTKEALKVSELQSDEEMEQKYVCRPDLKLQKKSRPSVKTALEFDFSSTAQSSLPHTAKNTKCKVERSKKCFLI